MDFKDPYEPWKRRMCELTTLCKDRSIQVALTMRLPGIHCYERFCLMEQNYEAWTLKMRAERKTTSMEVWLWRRMNRISWTEET